MSQPVAKKIQWPTCIQGAIPDTLSLVEANRGIFNLATVTGTSNQIASNILDATTKQPTINYGHALETLTAFDPDREHYRAYRQCYEYALALKLKNNSAFSPSLKQTRLAVELGLPALSLAVFCRRHQELNRYYEKPGTPVLLLYLLLRLIANMVETKHINPKFPFDSDRVCKAVSDLKLIKPYLDGIGIDSDDCQHLISTLQYLHQDLEQIASTVKNFHYQTPGRKPTCVDFQIDATNQEYSISSPTQKPLRNLKEQNQSNIGDCGPRAYFSHNAENDRGLENTMEKFVVPANLFFGNFLRILNLEAYVVVRLFRHHKYSKSQAFFYLIKKSGLIKEGCVVSGHGHYITEIVKALHYQHYGNIDRAAIQSYGYSYLGLSSLAPMSHLVVRENSHSKEVAEEFIEALLPVHPLTRASEEGDSWAFALTSEISPQASTALPAARIFNAALISA